MNTKNASNEAKKDAILCDVVTSYSIRSKTNNGEFCKQTFRIITSNDNKLDAALSVCKLVLTDEFELYEKYGFEDLKHFKNQRLYRQIFSIKLKTLIDVINWIANR